MLFLFLYHVHVLYTMKKSYQILTSILLFIASLAIHFLSFKLIEVNSNLDMQLLGFLVGLMLGSGLGLLIHAFFRNDQ